MLKKDTALPISGSFKLKELYAAIGTKARERNQEIKRDFYSLNASEYAYEDIIEYETYKLMLFVCPKSKSTISIKIIDK